MNKKGKILDAFAGYIIKLEDGKILRLFYTFLFLGYLMVFLSNFLGMDLSDEGLAILGYMPEQDLGITFTHYQLLLRKFFPNGLSFIVARHLRFFLVIISSVALLISVYKSKFRKHFKYFSLLVGATTLISLGSGIQVLSYNASIQIITTLYVACIIQYLDSSEKDKLFKSAVWLSLGTILMSSTYLVKLTSFFPLLIISLLIIFFTSWKNRKNLTINSFIFIFVLFLSLLFFGNWVVSFRKVFWDINQFSKTTERLKDGHGIILVGRYLFEFIQFFLILLFTSISYFLLNKLIRKVDRKVIRMVLYVLLVASVLLVVAGRRFSLGSLSIFFMLLLFVEYCADRFSKSRFSVDLDYKELLLMVLFPVIAVALTLGSNVWIINLSIFYLTIWSVSLLFIITKANKRLFINITYVLVVVAVLKVVYQGLVGPHRQGSLLTPHERYETKTRGVVYLDKEMYDYVSSIRGYLEKEGHYGREVVAVSRLPGLVYLLDSTMPGSINFTDEYWEVYCLSLAKANYKDPVVILRGNIPLELVSCLADYGVNLARDYSLGKVVEKGYSKYQSPTFIFLKKKEVI
jgi:hypothetical protein